MQPTFKQEALDQRLARLRALAQQDQSAAQDEAWSWIVEVGQRALRNRTVAFAELDALFHAGSANFTIDGPTQGALITTMFHPAVDRVVSALTHAWMPWLGKSFHAEAGAGRNLLSGSARLPAKVLWPRYQASVEPQRLTAFDFKTYIQASQGDASQEVMVLDYETVSDNPALVIQRVRDELVELLAGVYLGKIFWRKGVEKYKLIGYFALRA